MLFSKKSIQSTRIHDYPTPSAISIMIGVTLAVFGLSQSANAITSRNIVYTVDNQNYEGYYAEADTPSAPFILLIHDWDGLTDYERERANMLAEEGYNVLAADMFGQGVRPTALEDKKRLTTALYDDRNKIRRLLAGALATGQAQGNDVYNGITMGYCFGGSIALELARSGFPQRAFIPFHGDLATPEGQNYDATQGEVLVFHGTADQVVPFEDFADLATVLEGSEVPHEMITYSGARHAFTEFESDNYNERADTRSL